MSFDKSINYVSAHSLQPKYIESLHDCISKVVSQFFARLALNIKSLEQKGS